MTDNTRDIGEEKVRHKEPTDLIEASRMSLALKAAELLDRHLEMFGTIPGIQAEQELKQLFYDNKGEIIDLLKANAETRTCSSAGSTPPAVFSDPKVKAAFAKLDDFVGNCMGSAFHAAKNVRDELYQALATAPSPEDGKAVAWQCSARKQTLPEPADCNWPFCGCDPVANKVLEALDPPTLSRPSVEDVRRQTIEECAKFVEGLADKPGWSPGYKNSARKIAKAALASVTSKSGEGK